MTIICAPVLIYIICKTSPLRIYSSVALLALILGAGHLFDLGWSLAASFWANLNTLTLSRSQQVDLVTMSGLNNLSSQFIHVAFPWVGIYIYALQQNQHRKKKYVFVSFLLMLLLFYGIYVSSLKFLAVVLMFHKTIPDQLDENFFGLIALTEFFNLLFVRTRSSIKWYPKIVVTLIMAFMVHVRCTTYGFYYLGLFLLTLLVFYIML